MMPSGAGPASTGVSARYHAQLAMIGLSRSSSSALRMTLTWTPSCPGWDGTDREARRGTATICPRCLRSSLSAEVSDLVPSIRVVTVRQLVPLGLAEMAPGPELAVLLADIETSALTGTDAVDVLRARHRQLSHDQAQLLAAMVQVGLCDPEARPGEVARLAEAPPYAADEIRAALAWTRRAADREHCFAETLVQQMPAVFAALDTGRIDRAKAWIFTDYCAELTAQHTEAVCQRLLPHASRLTTGELAARIKKIAIALDPDWAARRYACAVRERNVVGYLNDDGTATVTGSQLPTDQAAAACARIEDLAKAAKRAGHPGRVGHLRADLYLGLLDGRWQRLTRDQIITDLLAHATDNTSDADAADARDSDALAGNDHAADVDGSTDRDISPDGDDSPDDHDGPTGGDCAPAQLGVELRVGLSTLLGRDHHPGEIPGWGPIGADLARTMATAQRGSPWWFAITDDTGQLVFAGITRCRPHTSGRPSPPRRGGVVELHVPERLLTQLAADPASCGEWAGVVADIAHKNQHRTPVLQDPHARFAGAALRRHIQLRDRSCTFTGCRCPARHADLDHTIDHAHHGRTTDINQGPACRHDHRLKHVGGWRLSQPQPGHFIWLSPLRRTYHTQPPPIILDLPEPEPGPPYPVYAPRATVEGLSILQRPPPQPHPPPRPPRQPIDPDEPPPF